MVEKSASLEERVAGLEEKVAELVMAVSDLQAGVAISAVTKSAESKRAARKVAAAGEASDEILSWVDKSYLLSRIATTSFIVAVALALRTAADLSLIHI